MSALVCTRFPQGSARTPNVFLNLPVEAGKEYFVEYTQENMMELIRLRKPEEGKPMVRGYEYLRVE